MPRAGNIEPFHAFRIPPRPIVGHKCSRDTVMTAP